MLVPVEVGAVGLGDHHGRLGDLTVIFRVSQAGEIDEVGPNGDGSGVKFIPWAVVFIHAAVPGKLAVDEHAPGGARVALNL